MARAVSWPGSPKLLKKLEVALVFFLHFFRDYLKQARALSQASVSGEIKTGTGEIKTGTGEIKTGTGKIKTGTAKSKQEPF